MSKSTENSNWFKCKELKLRNIFLIFTALLVSCTAQSVSETRASQNDSSGSFSIEGKWYLYSEGQFSKDDYLIIKKDKATLFITLFDSLKKYEGTISKQDNSNFYGEVLPFGRIRLGVRKSIDDTFDGALVLNIISEPEELEFGTYISEEKLVKNN